MPNTYVPAGYENAGASQIRDCFHRVVVRADVRVHACAQVTNPDRAIHTSAEALAVGATKARVEHGSLVRVLMHLNVVSGIVQPDSVVPGRHQQ